MADNNMPKSLKALDEILDTCMLRLIGNDAMTGHTLEKVKNDPLLPGAYQISDTGDGLVRGVYAPEDLEQAVIHILFLCSDVVVKPRMVTYREVYLHLARQQTNLRGHCPVCGTRDLARHNVPVHQEHLRTAVPCQHKWVRVGGEDSYCGKCFLTPEGTKAE